MDPGTSLSAALSAWLHLHVHTADPGARQRGARLLGIEVLDPRGVVELAPGALRFAAVGEGEPYGLVRRLVGTGLARWDAVALMCTGEATRIVTGAAAAAIVTVVVDGAGVVGGSVSSVAPDGSTADVVRGSEMHGVLADHMRAAALGQSPPSLGWEGPGGTPQHGDPSAA